MIPSLVTETKPVGWVCTACGSADGHPVGGGAVGSFAQLDARYTVGYCDVCTVAHPAKARKTPRPTSQLVRADLFDPAAFAIRKDKDKLGKLVKALSAGTATVQLTDPECYSLVTLWDKYGWPGYSPSDSIREGAAKYAAEMTPKAAPGGAKKRKPKNKARGW